MLQHYRLSFFTLFSFLLFALVPAQIFVGKDAVFTVSEATLISQQPTDSTRSVPLAGEVFIVDNTVVLNVENLLNADVIYVHTAVATKKKNKKSSAPVFAAEEKKERIYPKIASPKAVQNFLPANEVHFVSGKISATTAVPEPVHFYKGAVSRLEQISFGSKGSQEDQNFYALGNRCFLLFNFLQIRPPPAMSFSV